MSHYAVAVFSEDGDFERLLAPYDEENPEFKVFIPEDYAEIQERFEKFQKQNPKWTMEMYLESNGLHQEDGVWGYRANPHGYWDYYTLDGKDYLFNLKPKTGYHTLKKRGEKCYRKSDYDWEEEDEEAVESAEKFWDHYIATEVNGEPPSLYKREYYLERFGTKEQYVHERSITVPYAFITPDGVWHSPGEVGWFGLSDETAESWNKYEEEWFSYLHRDDNPFVSITDCHI